MSLTILKSYKRYQGSWASLLFGRTQGDNWGSCWSRWSKELCQVLVVYLFFQVFGLYLEWTMEWLMCLFYWIILI